MLLSTRKPEIEYLSQKLNEISTELTSSIDIEMRRLKEEELELQNALKLKTRSDLIRTMEKELQMDYLNETLSNQNLSNSNYLKSTSFNNSYNLVDSLEDDLRKSHLILDNLMKEYNQTKYLNAQTSNLSKQNLTNTSFKTEQLDYDQTKYVNPNVVYATKSKKLTKPETIRTVRVYMNTPTQDLNKQQTLSYSSKIDDLYRSKSATNLNRSELFDNRNLSSSNNPYASSLLNERDFHKSIRDKYFYSDKEKINGIQKSKLRNSANFQTKSSSGYTTLPVSKTLIHNKPWSYGKVECIYYPFRDSKVKNK